MLKFQIFIYPNYPKFMYINYLKPNTNMQISESLDIRIFWYFGFGILDSSESVLDADFFEHPYLYVTRFDKIQIKPFEGRNPVCLSAVVVMMKDGDE